MKLIAERNFRFYTNPPIYYPYVLRNIHQKKHKDYKHEIVDCGINDLFEDGEHSEQKLLYWDSLDLGKDWKIVPDCPDIFKEFGKQSPQGFDSIGYSKFLLKSWYDPDNPQHVPVLQGLYDNYESFIDYFKWFTKHYDMPDVLAVGTMCKSGNRGFVKKLLRDLRSMIPDDTWIHAFGLRAYHLPNVYEYINSWDSMAWTFPRGSGLPSAKNKQMRIDYFNAYMGTISRLTHGMYVYDYQEQEFIQEYSNTNLEEWF